VKAKKQARKERNERLDQGRKGWIAETTNNWSILCENSWKVEVQ
jgi:hypothetical protein